MTTMNGVTIAAAGPKMLQMRWRCNGAKRVSMGFPTAKRLVGERGEWTAGGRSPRLKVAPPLPLNAWDRR
jgi:hypothetical protein